MKKQRFIWVLASVALVATMMGVSTAGAGVPDTASGRWAGRAAIARLGDRLPQVARQNGLSTAELRRNFVDDSTLFVDNTDALLYVEPVAPEQAPGDFTPFDAAIPDSETFLLESRPGANRVIYLDFDGEMISGTAWNGSAGGDCYAEPYDTDTFPASFSSAEMAVVKSVWKRVAEDYAPFDVNVTTRDPGFDAINRSGSTDTQFGTRALITKSVTPCSNGKTFYQSVCANGCGGVAYVGVFDNTGTNHSYYQPALVFQNGVSGGKNIAEATSHEVGHNIGLSHDGNTTGCGTTGVDPCGYYYGQGSWAPIMGVGYNRAIVQWSKGEYANANNTQDDFVVAGSNGLPLRVDDHGNTTATGTGLAGPTISASGVISTAADVDAFNITAGAGPLSITASPVPTSPDLDISLELRDASGTLLASANPASSSSGSDTSTGMAATVTATIPATGVYTLTVDGVGNGDPLTTGYSDYGSLGYYQLSGTAPSAGNQPPVASFTMTPTSGTTPLAVTVDGAGSSDPEGGPLTYAWNFGNGTTGTGVSGSTTYTTAGTYTVTLTVTDDASLTSTTTRTITVSAPAPRIDVSALTITGTKNKTNVSSTATVTVRDNNGSAVSSATVTGQWFLGTKLLSTKSATTSTSGVAAVASGSVKATTGQVLKFCVTNVAKTGTIWDTTVFAPATATDCVTWAVP